MNEMLKIICGTIVLCYFIRYICIWNCHNMEYKLYEEKHVKKKSKSPLVVRPYYHKNPQNNKSPYWGYIVFDSAKDEPFTGEGGNDIFNLCYNVRC